MELYDIVEAASSLMRDKSTTLVLHRSMKQHPKFKVYKIFEYKLYLVNSGNNTKTLLLEKAFTKNTPSDEIIKAWNASDKEYLPVLIKWLTTNEYTSWL